MAMTYLTGIMHNPVFLSAAAGWLISQVSKIIRAAIKNRGLSWEIVGASGGMPSSHSATVMGLLTSTIVTYGTAGFEFPMALFFSIIVMYDALGVRYETGQQGKYLNRLSRKLSKNDRDLALKRPFDEKAGHTLPEVLVGALVGIAAGLIIGIAFKRM